MSVAKVRVIGRFDSASKTQTATVVMDRDVGLFSVRPLRRRRIYSLPLSVVAEMVVQWNIRAELLERRRMRSAKRAESRARARRQGGSA